MENIQPHPVKGKLPPATFQTLFVAVRLAVDVAVSLVAPALAYFFRFEIVSPEIPNPGHTNYLFLGYVFAALNIYFFITFGTYRPVRGRSIIDENFGVAKVVGASTLIMLAFTFFFTRFLYSRLTMIYAMLFGMFLLGLGRAMALVLERALLRRGHGLKRLLFVGTGRNFKSLTRAVSQRPDLGFTLCGYVEERADGALAGIPLLGPVEELEPLILRHGVQQIIVTLRPDRHEAVSGIVDLCDRHGVDCLVAPDMQEMIVGGHNYDEIAGIPVIRIKGLRMRGPAAFIKRAADVAMSLALLIPLLPVMMLIGIAIRLDSPGPVFYMQKRVGLDGRVFWMYKFRSMRTNVESSEGPGWSRDQDPRITRLGMILRKMSLDELPQIFNVLRGEMSLVGPRPERPYFVEQFEKDVPRYMQRHRAKAGMTGWAQVNGLRGDTSIEERVQYDLYYIENWSMGFDIKIMILTAVDILKEIPGVIKRLKR
jgi:exopolysaccharide biosynthesis polyprenyl glycosylphosphotransferase